MMKKVCIFCGSSFGNNEIYKEEAYKLGRFLGENKLDLIYGGGNVGLMGILSKTAIEHGSNVTGVIPQKIYDQVEHIELSDLHIVETMHERKSKMYELADGFISLPGGIGTLEEIAEILTWQQIGYHHKPIGILNINNFYNPFRDMLLHMEREGFLRREFFDTLIVQDNVPALLEKMNIFQPTLRSKWD